MKNYLSLAAAAALSVSVATPALAVTKFTEIPATNVSGTLTVSNNGVVALISYPHLYKWSATTGLTSLSVLTGSFSDSYIGMTSISTDGSIVAFTGNGSQWTDAHIFTGTQKRTISYNTMWGTTRLSSDGKILGGSYSPGNNGTYNPATMNLATSVITSNTNPSLLNMTAIDLSSTGAVKLLASPVYPDSYMQSFAWVDAAGTVKNVPLSLSSDLSNDGNTVIGGYCSVSGVSYQACSWNSSTGALKALGNFSAYSANLNASVVVGTQAPGVGIIWDATNGAKDIKTVLSAKGVNISGWSNIVLMDISDDGKYIVGKGKNPSGVTKPFLIQLK